MRIAVPRESAPGERRVALVPESCKKLIQIGYDIAVESSFVARKTFLSSRRGAYILPKYLFGRPLDQIGVNALTPLLPFAFRRAILMDCHGTLTKKPHRGL